MTDLTKRWEIYPRAPKAHFGNFPDLQPLIVQILYNRGIYEEAEVYEFLSGDRPQALQNPEQMKGVVAAVERILQAISVGENIVVYGDYDADGVTATVLMVQVLRSLGGRVKPYIPNRFEEGYGLNKQAIADLADEEASLVITVDCGIRSVDEVTYGNELGLSFIITDHHRVSKDEVGQDIIPPAAAIINPKQMDCDYPFKELAGVGIAFKIVQALKQAVSPEDSRQPGLAEEDLLDLVAIGTVADMVPLIGENRMLVKKGLVYINDPRRIGLRALVEQSRLDLGHITAGSIGFIIGPRLNAAGRLTHAQLAYKLLSTKDPLEAYQLAETLSQINYERQQMTQTFVDQAREQILVDDELAPLYLITDPNFNPGVVGLVASRLTDEFYRPMLVAQRGNTHTKGSGRSISEFDITAALDQCAELLVKYGGHAAAAGFTIENRNLAAFQARLTELAHEQLADKLLRKTLSIDAEINLRGVTYQLVKDIQELQPFGYNNPTPRFMTKGLLVKHQTVVGRDGGHLKLKLFDGKRVWDTIGFGMGYIWPPQIKLTKVDAVYNLEFNTWNGQTSLQLNLKDIKPCQV